ncbi:hypothetical protein B0J13DRAFT_177294 [Dactylonectria estremocensis]|uniref:Uncharacterized protein n=1 Tax=Dactylonectria estremocensis TaxID=1079267 RepID=A0A9P9JEP1_9HYPO|nr:hypothetical protein B0J13DRAFT_177294 [Dactylonectria estremocensis]
MAENHDNQRPPKPAGPRAGFSVDAEESSAPGNQPLSIASFDLQTPGGARLTDSGTATSQQQTARPTVPNSGHHISHKSGKKDKGKVTIIVEPPKPAPAESHRERQLLRRRHMPSYSSSSYRDRPNPFNERVYPEFGYYGNSSHGIPGTHTVPYNPIHEFYPNYPNRRLPPEHANSSSRFTQSFRPQSPITSPPETPKRHEAERLSHKHEDVERLSRELESLKEASKKREEAELYRLRQDNEEPGESSKNRDVESLLVELRAKEERVRMLEIAIQLQAEREVEADHQRRVASETAAEKERPKRESEVRNETPRDTLARVEAEKQFQLDNIQRMVERLEEQRQKDEQRRRKEELEGEEQRKLAEEREREENRREQERIQTMEQEALQRLRDEWARQQMLEADKQAEEEKLRLEQEDKKRAEQEAMERLRETIREEEAELVRKEHGKRQEEQRLLREALEEEGRKEANRIAAEEETQRRIEEGVKQKISEKLSLEVQRLQYDLRRHTWGARPDLIHGIPQRRGQEVSFRQQDQLARDPAWEFPSSNPFSRNRRRVLRNHQHQQPRFLEDSSRFPASTENHLFGGACEQTHWTFDDGVDPRSYFGGDGQLRQSSYADDGYEAPFSPVALRGNSRFGEDQVYEASGVVAQDNWQQPSHMAYQVPVTQSELGQSNPDETQSNADHSDTLMNGNGLHGMSVADQYHLERHISNPNGANIRTVQHTSPSHDISKPGVYGTEHYSNRMNGTGSRGQVQVNGNSETHRLPNQHKPMQPPPSGPPAPTPPTQMPPQPAPGRLFREAPILNGNGQFSDDRGTVEGFPPPFDSQQRPQVAQYLQLDQRTAIEVFKNVPIIILPFIPTNNMQFDQTQESREEKAKTQAQAHSANMVNGF